MNSNKVVVITGTSSGIGFNLAETLGKQGYKVYGLSRKMAQSDFFTSFSVDITQPTEIANAIAVISDNEGKIEYKWIDKDITEQ